ncbi:MAG TPA: DEAD/DEAH box helicase, partial [Acidobacteria bacterium]|nr:DEAD/DEAH box helicase [Acidobacteriota bacterium]
MTAVTHNHRLRYAPTVEHDHTPSTDPVADDGHPRTVPSLADYLPAGDPEPDVILDRFLAWCTDAGFELYPAQEEALLEVMAGRHVILNTPTGSGKSLVALGLHFRALAWGERSFYTSPIKALASEKFFSLCDLFGPERVGMLT